MSKYNTQDEMLQELIGLVESAKLAGFNAKSLSYEGSDGGYSNQMAGYYDTKSVVRDLRKLINSEVRSVLERIEDELAHRMKINLIENVGKLENGKYVKLKYLLPYIEAEKAKYGGNDVHRVDTYSNGVESTVKTTFKDGTVKIEKTKNG